MKFKGSLIKSDKTYDFVRSLKSGIIPSFAVLIILLFSSTFSSLVLTTKYKEHYALAFLKDDYDAEMILTVFLIIAGIFSGLFVFRSFGNRQNVNVLLSLGLKRKTLLGNRCLALLSEMLFAVIAPCTMTLAINIQAYGVSVYMIEVYIFLIISSFSIIFVGFSIGTLSAVLAGTKTEATITSFALAVMPHGIILFVFSCIKFFLRGYYVMYESGSFYLSSDFFSLDGINPILMRYCNLLLMTFSESYDERKLVLPSKLHMYASYQQPAYLDFSEYLPFIVWLIVSIFILIISGHLLKKRKAEITGLFNSSKAVAAIISVTAVIYASGLGLAFGIFNARTHMESADSSFYVMGGYEKFVVLSQMILYGLIALLICMLVYSMNLRRFVSRLKFSPLVLLTLIVPLICVTGGFGFSERIPNDDEIEKIVVQYPFAPKECIFESVLEAESDYPARLSGFQSEKDKQLVISLHRLLIEGEIKQAPCYIQITYKLKNGKEVLRFYPEYSNEALLEALNLFDSDTTEEYFYKRLSDRSSWFTTEELIKYLNENPFTDITELMRELPVNKFENIRGVNLKLSESAEIVDILPYVDKEKYDKLLQSIARDYRQMTAKDYYFPEKPCEYILLVNAFEDNVVNDYEIITSYRLYIYASMENTLSFLNTLKPGETQSENKITSVALYECNAVQFYRQRPTEFIKGTASAYIAAKEGKKTVIPYAVYANATDVASFVGELHPAYLSIGKNVSYALVTYSDGNEAVYIVKK